MEEQAKVYIVTRGEYSDRSIVAVLSTQEKAEEYCRLHEAHAYYPEGICVEEYDLDVPAAQYYHYMIFMLVSTGEVTDGWKTLSRHDQSTEPQVLKDRDMALWCVRAYGHDRESAIKIASDFRAKYLAERAGL